MKALMSHRVEWSVVAVCLVAASVVAGCQSGQPAGADGAGPPVGGMPAMAVEVVTVASTPVEESSEFVGTVKSRRSVTVQPQVEGFVTRIAVVSGARVAAGATLMEIDAGRQEATVAWWATCRFAWATA